MAKVPSSLRLMRLPYGRNNDRTAAILASMGLPIIQWSVEGEKDELERSLDQLVARITSYNVCYTKLLRQ